MFGCLRLLLAGMVAWSHLPNSSVTFDGHAVDLGVAAVCVFFLLSGNVVAGLLRPGTALAGRFWTFVRERALRILPLYWLFLVAAAVAAYHPPHAAYGLGTWAANITVIPLDFYQQFPLGPSTMFNGPTWSLGLELQFYVLAPFILRNPRRIAITMAASLAFQIYVAAGHLPSDAWGYRYVPGTIFLFCAGAWIRRWSEGAVPLAPVGVVWITNVIVLGWLLADNRFDVPYLGTFELGCVAGIPVVVFLSRLSRRTWDHRIGELAYGVFLCHTPLKELAGQHGWFAPRDEVWLYFGSCLAIAWLAHRVAEKPLEALRRNLRDGPTRRTPDPLSAAASAG